MAGFQGKNIVLVEDEDGFQVPMMMTEVVVVGDEDYGTGHMVEVKRQGAEMRDGKAVQTTPSDGTPPDSGGEKITFKPKPMERKGGERLSAYLASAECLPGLCADGYEGTDADAIRELSRERLELLHALCVYDG